MINILHIGAKSLVLGVISDASVAYYSGKAKPHYLMPAIPHWGFWHYVHYAMRVADWNAKHPI